MSRIASRVDEGLGNSSYLVELDDGRALVIDPGRHPGPYLEAARHRNLTVAYTVETHLHADFVSGSRELAAHSATVVASAAGGAEFPHRGLADGDELDLGGLRLRALATPGHTPEHLACLLLGGDRPVALFSGGSLLVGAVARTDLRDVNRAGPVVYGDPQPALTPLEVGEACRLVPGGAQMIDARPVDAFAAGHLPGADHIELGALLDRQDVRGPVTVMCGHGERAMTAASLLAARGVDGLAVAVGGPEDWAVAIGRPLETGR